MLTKSDAVIGKRVQWRPSDAMEHPCFGTIRDVKPDGEVIVEYDDGGMAAPIPITLSLPSSLLDAERGLVPPLLCLALSKNRKSWTTKETPKTHVLRLRPRFN